MEREGRIGNRGLHYRINPALPDGLTYLDIHPHDFTGILFYRLGPGGEEITNTPILPEEIDLVNDLLIIFKREYKDYFLFMNRKNEKS